MRDILIFNKTNFRTKPGPIFFFLQDNPIRFKTKLVGYNLKYSSVHLNKNILLFNCFTFDNIISSKQLNHIEIYLRCWFGISLKLTRLNNLSNVVWSFHILKLLTKYIIRSYEQEFIQPFVCSSRIKWLFVQSAILSSLYTLYFYGFLHN